MNYSQIVNELETILHNQKDINKAVLTEFIYGLKLDIEVEDELSSLQLVVSYLSEYLAKNNVGNNTATLLKATMSRIKTAKALIHFFKHCYIKTLIKPSRIVRVLDVHKLDADKITAHQAYQSHVTQNTRKDVINNGREINEYIIERIGELCTTHGLDKGIVLSKARSVLKLRAINSTATLKVTLDQLYISLLNLLSRKRLTTLALPPDIDTLGNPVSMVNKFINHLNSTIVLSIGSGELNESVKLKAAITASDSKCGKYADEVVETDKSRKKKIIEEKIKELDELTEGVAVLIKLLQEARES